MPICWISFILVFIFPIFILLGFYKPLTKIVASIAIFISSLCMTYHFVIYGLKMINGNEMTIVTIGFFVTVLLMGRLMLKKKDGDVIKERII